MMNFKKVPKVIMHVMMNGCEFIKDGFDYKRDWVVVPKSKYFKKMLIEGLNGYDSGASYYFDGKIAFDFDVKDFIDYEELND